MTPPEGPEPVQTGAAEALGQAEQTSAAREPDAAPALSASHPGWLAAGVSLLVAVLVAAVVGTAAGFGGYWLASHGALPGRQSSTVRVLPAETDEPVIAAAAAAVPSVVNIDISGAPVSVESDPHDVPESHPNVPVSSSGSGVAFKSANGGGTYILTNNHVVEDADKIVVRTNDGERQEAQLVGRDPDTDVAVIKVKGTVPLADIGDSDELTVGQLVIAIGSPFGLEHSVTSGVISAIGRSLPDTFDNGEGIYPLVDVIQTDAAINPGNSGGALVDRAGKLIGINTAIYSRGGANDGIGFAVPVNTAVRIATELIEKGRADHPFLGVVGQTVTPQFAEEEKLPVDEGAYIVDLTAGTNAVKAGIQKGDIIVGLDDVKIRSMDDLILAVRKKAVGDEVTVKLYRDGKVLELKMTVGAKPDNLSPPTAPESGNDSTKTP